MHLRIGKVQVLVHGISILLMPGLLSAQTSTREDVRVLEELIPELEGIAPDSGLHFIDRALEAVGLDGDPEVLYYLLSYRAEQLYYEGLFDEAMSNALNALDIARKLSDSLLIANEYNLIGLVYENVQNDRDAIPYLRNALQWFPMESEIRYPLSELHQIHGNLGQCLTRVGEHDEAEEHLLRSRELAHKKGIRRGVAVADWALGGLELARGRPRTAIQLLHRSLGMAGNDPDVALLDRSDLACAWLDLDSRDSALFNLKAGFAMLDEVPGISITSKQGFLKKASQIYARLGQDNMALRTMMGWYALDSSINARNERSAVAALKDLYETNEKLVTEKFRRQQYVDALERVRHSRKLLLYGSILGILGLIGAILIYRSRVRGMQRLAELEHLRSQQEITISEYHIREQLARDMHDDLGAGISALKLKCEMALRMGTNGNATHEFMQLAEQAGELMSNMRQILWTLNSDSCSVSDLAAHCGEYARQYLPNDRITLDLKVADKWPDQEMTPDARRNIFLVLKEALHNVVKHASADLVKITMLWEDAFSLVIHDNGIGYDPFYQRIGHNGIRNMQLRIEELGGKLNITNDRGTRLEVRVPMERILSKSLVHEQHE